MGSFRKGTRAAYKAGQDLSTHQHKFVKLGSADDEILLCGDGEAAIGVLTNTPKQGEDAEVAVDGGVQVKMDASGCARGASIASAANGFGKAVTSGTAYAVAEETGVQNQEVAVVLDRHVGRSL